MIENFTFKLKDGRAFSYTVDTSVSYTSEADRLSDLPSWTKLEYQQCKHCPFTSSEKAFCPPASKLSNLIDAFGNVVSSEQLEVLYKREEAGLTIHRTLDAQMALSALFIAVIFASDCPHLSQFNRLREYFIPFADQHQIVFRALAWLLVKQYVEGKNRSLAEVEEEINTSLRNAETALEGLNARVREVSEKDASSNAFTRLIFLSHLFFWNKEKVLEKLREQFDLSSS